MKLTQDNEFVHALVDLEKAFKACRNLESAVYDLAGPAGEDRYTAKVYALIDDSKGVSWNIRGLDKALQEGEDSLVRRVRDTHMARLREIVKRLKRIAKATTVLLDEGIF